VPRVIGVGLMVTRRDVKYRMMECMGKMKRRSAMKEIQDLMQWLLGVALIIAGILLLWDPTRGGCV
jgi:hypothetical protein